LSLAAREIVDPHVVLFNLLLEGVLLLDLIIDLKQKIDILLHDLGVLFLVDFLILDHHSLQVIDVLLEESSLVHLISIHVRVAGIVLVALFLNVDSVKSDDSSL